MIRQAPKPVDLRHPEDRLIASVERLEWLTDLFEIKLLPAGPAPR